MAHHDGAPLEETTRNDDEEDSANDLPGIKSGETFHHRRSGLTPRLSGQMRARTCAAPAHRRSCRGCSRVALQSVLRLDSTVVSVAGCGFSVDCPANYSLVDVNRSAAQWDPTRSAWQRSLERDRAAAEAACALSLIGSMNGHTGLPSGGYCLHDAIPPRANVTLPGGRSYRQPLEYMYMADGIIVAALLELLNPGHSLSDFGAGVGQYGHALFSVDPTVRWFGYDGAGNVETWTNGFVRWFDLTIPLSLPRTDWVMSLEVAEHIPNSAEHMVLRNLHAHNCRGIIISWAALSQIGFDHINNHRNEYVIRQVTQLGYVLNRTLTARFRTGRPVPGMKTYRWLRHVMAFDRITLLPDCEPGVAGL